VKVRFQYVIPGILIFALGLLWSLQGGGVVKGSAMTGQHLWLIVGIFLALAGLVITILGLTGREQQS
jgi:hypothetical protein